jgi:hypothetical protein
MGRQTVSGALTFTPVTGTGAPGFATMLELVADGSHTPDFSSFKRLSTVDYDTSTGVVNYIMFIKLDSEYGVVISQEQVSGAAATLIDDFNRTDNAATLGAMSADPSTSWQYANSSLWGIASNKANNTDLHTGGGAQRIAFINGLSSGTLAVRARTSGTVSSFSIIIYYQDSTNMVLLNVFASGGSGSINLYKVISGTYTAIDTATLSMAINHDFEFSIVFNGTAIALSIDTVSVFGGTYSLGGLQANAKQGFCVYKGAGTGDDEGTTFDNFSVLP